MAKKLLIIGSLQVGKGTVTSFIGAGTETTHIDKEDAKGYGIKAGEFDKLVDRGVLVADDGTGAEPVNDKSKEMSAAKYKQFVTAAESLEQGEEKNWTTDNKPEVGALKDAGCKVTADQRDEAWALYLAD